MFKNLIIGIMLTVTTVTAIGQGYVESPYSRFGVGDLINNTSSRSMAMGGVSYAVPARTYINYLNPANIASIDSLTFTFDFGVNGGARNYITSEMSSPESRSDIQITNLIFGFRVTNYWAVSLGALPYSNVAYDIEYHESEKFDVKKHYRFAGNGGLSRVFWTNAFNITPNLQLGVNASYIFGNIHQNNSLNFDDESGAYANTLQAKSIGIRDFMFDFGAKYRLKINSKNNLHFAAVYNPSSNMKAHHRTAVYNFPSVGGSALVDTIFNSGKQHGIVTIPQKIGFGICYEHDEKILLAFDYTMQNWSEAKFFDMTDSLNNSNNFNLGLEYIPAGYYGRPLRYSQAVSYRIGAHFNNTYLNIGNNNNDNRINDFGISFGVGLPIERSNTSFNIAVQVGQRGTVKNDLIKENYIIFAVNFNLSDRWFMQRKFE